VVAKKTAKKLQENNFAALCTSSLQPADNVSSDGNDELQRH